MNKLIQANLNRLWKSKEFIITAIAMFLLAVYRVFAVKQDPINTMEDGFFIYIIVIGIIMAVFVSLYVGVESSNFTLRNKLIVGHRRSNIYLANFIVCTLAGWLLCIAYFVPSLLIGLPLIGTFETEMWSLISTVLVGLLLTAVYSAIFVFIGMLLSSRAVIAVVSLILAFVLIVAGANVRSRLSEPEKNEIMAVSFDGVYQTGEYADNPLFLKGVKRTVYEFLNDFLPGGQAITLSAMVGDISAPPVKIVIYDIIFIFLLNFCGLILFHKKDIK